LTIGKLVRYCAFSLNILCSPSLVSQVAQGSGYQGKERIHGR